MTQVNSPFMLSKLRPLNEFSRSQNNYLEQLERVVQQLYRRTGSETDSVSDSSNGDFTSALLYFDDRINKTISSAYSTEGDELLEVTAACTITLDEPGSVTIYVNTTGYVTVTDGTDSVIITEKGTVISFKWVEEFAEWVTGA